MVAQGVWLKIGHILIFDDPRPPRLLTGVYGHDVPLAAVDAEAQFSDLAGVGAEEKIGVGR